VEAVHFVQESKIGWFYNKSQLGVNILNVFFIESLGDELCKDSKDADECTVELVYEHDIYEIKKSPYGVIRVVIAYAKMQLTLIIFFNSLNYDFKSHFIVHLHNFGNCMSLWGFSKFSKVILLFLGWALRG